MISLDKNRDYGYIAGHFEEGDPMHGAAFSQDGFLFTNDGELLESALTEKDKIRLEQFVKRQDAIEAAKAAFQQIAGDTDPEILSKIISTDALNKPAGDDEDVDLVAWARNEKRYNYGKVAKAFRDRFNQSPVNKQQGLEILAAAGLIPALASAPTIPAAQ